ncbi:MAG: hypothetical protein HY851_00675 [candidate division Zixibacteria bacterium]|nr:hypothetical protein [candidate division Zixibacteria bacterium]
MSKNKEWPVFWISGPVWNVITIVLGMVAAYFMTIQQLRVDLAAKAEAAVVGTLDKKISGLEVYLKEAVVNKQQFYEHTQKMETRLDRIERYLIDQTGETRGKK